MKFWVSFTQVLLGTTFIGSASAQPPSPAQMHLDRALALANAYNWADAAPEFVKAERLSLQNNWMYLQ